MKPLSRTLLKIASVKLAALAVLLVLGAAATAMAQNPRIQTSQLDALAAKASETVDVNIDESLMALTTKFLSSTDEDEKKVKELVSGLKGIYVKSFEFESEGQYTDADLESIRSQLRNPAWSRIINAKSKKDGSIEVYLMHTGAQISGLAVLATELKEITVINIVGPVDLEKLTKLEGEFGIPDLGTRGLKTEAQELKLRSGQLMKKSIATSFIVLALLGFVPTTQGKDDGFGDVVKLIEQFYHVKHEGIPLLARAGLKTATTVARISGGPRRQIAEAGSVKVAYFDDQDFRPNGSYAGFKSSMNSVLTGWSPLIQVASPKEEAQTYIYLREAGNKFNVMVVTIEQREGCVVQVNVSPESLAKLMRNPDEMGNTITVEATTNDKE